MSEIVSQLKKIDISTSINDVGPAKEAGQKLFVLITDTWDYYQDTFKSNYQTDDFVCVTSSKLIEWSDKEVRELTWQATAVLMEWSMQNANLLVKLRHQRSRRETPILALCGESETEHVAALFMGADGTMSRTFNPVILDAKLVAYQRAMGEQKQPEASQKWVPDGLFANSSNNPNLLQTGSLYVDEAARVFYIEGGPVSLTPIEFDLMTFLMKHEGVCVRRDDLINQVWGIGFETGTNFLDVHIFALRQKLKQSGLPSCIFTVRGVGYRFESPQ